MRFSGLVYDSRPFYNEEKQTDVFFFVFCNIVAIHTNTGFTFVCIINDNIHNNNIYIIYIYIYISSKKFYIRRNNNKVDSTETGRIVIAIAYSLKWCRKKKRGYTTLCELMMIKFYRHYLIYKYNFICSLFWTTHKLTNDIKII